MAAILPANTGLVTQGDTIDPWPHLWESLGSRDPLPGGKFDKCLFDYVTRPISQHFPLLLPS